MVSPWCDSVENNGPMDSFLASEGATFVGRLNGCLAGFDTFEGLLRELGHGDIPFDMREGLGSFLAGMAR